MARATATAGPGPTSSANMAASALLLPGQPLPSAYTKEPRPFLGSGCYEHGGKVLASVVGRARRDGSVLSVVGTNDTSQAPDIGSIVIGTISRLTPTQAHLQIQISGNHPVPESSEEFTGLIRLADIRLTERDKIKMGECFRLGDLVKAKVLSLGDARSYYLTTAANELGVIWAKSDIGNVMVPVSYQDMEDTTTGKTERRKVAKPEDV